MKSNKPKQTNKKKVFTKKKKKLLPSENRNERKKSRIDHKKYKMIRVKCYCKKEYNFMFSDRVHIDNIMDIGSCIFCHKMSLETNFSDEKIKRYKDK